VTLLEVAHAVDYLHSLQSRTPRPQAKTFSSSRQDLAFSQGLRPASPQVPASPGFSFLQPQVVFFFFSALLNFQECSLGL
jgi:hypothetical protein